MRRIFVICSQHFSADSLLLALDMFYERGEADLLVESSRKGKRYLSRDLAPVISAQTGM